GPAGSGGNAAAIAGSSSVTASALDALKAAETGVESFNLTLTDGKGGSSVQSVSITLTGTNDGPTATADFAKTDEDTATKIDLLGNDKDVDGDALTLVSTSASEYGAAIKIDGGAVVYDPSASAKLQALGAGEMATDKFTYTVRDANGAETPQTVTVSVAGLVDKVESELVASFESGLDKGWQQTGDVTTAKGGTEGKMAALLSTNDAKDQKEVEGWLQLDKGTLDKLGYGDADEGSAVRSKVDLDEGDTLNFDWLFGAAAKPEGNDFAFVTLRHNGTNEVFGLMDVKAVGEGKNSGWQSFSFKAEEAGSYEIGIGVMDVGSSDGHSTLMLDNVWFG
ncbi:MAG: Ig-like domain-containing protein, partial [Roseococcus sp.]